MPYNTIKITILQKLKLYVLCHSNNHTIKQSHSYSKIMSYCIQQLLLDMHVLLRVELDEISQINRTIQRCSLLPTHHQSRIAFVDLIQMHVQYYLQVE